MALGRAQAILIGVLAVIIIVAVAAWVWVSEPAIEQVSTPPPNQFDTALVQTGAHLAAAGNCIQCHTSENGENFVGGFRVPTPFGDIVSANITPDSETGIGTWSEEAFARAMRQGIRRDGAHLYPAFPYTHFTLLSDDDVEALYAYFMTREPVKNDPGSPDLPFPLNIRAVMAGWNMLYFDPGRFTPAPTMGDVWNRGAYLAEGLGHCSSCHTERNWAGAEIQKARYEGGEGEGWYGPALDGSGPQATAWSVEALNAYLRGGFAEDHGTPAGPMREVARNLQRIPDEDVEAIATYIASLSDTPARLGENAGAPAERDSTYSVLTAYNRPADGAAQSGEDVFAGACASCHFNGGEQPYYRPVDLAMSSAVKAPDARNFLHIVLDGVHPEPGQRSRIMPGFEDTLTEQQVAMLADYVRVHFTGLPAWEDVGSQLDTIMNGEDEE